MTSYLLNKDECKKYTTHHIRTKERFDYWTNVVCDKIINMHCQPLSDEPFTGSLLCCRYGTINILEMHARPHKIMRSKSALASLDNDSMIFTLTLNGHSQKTASRKYLSTSHGDISVLDGSREQELTTFSDIQALVFIISKSLFSNYLFNIEDYNATTISTQNLAGKLTSDYLKSFATHIGEPFLGSEESVEKNIIQLISNCLLAEREFDSSKPFIQNHLLDHIKRFISKNACNPDLSANTLAKQYRMSLRYLHKLFEGHDFTVSRYILKCRLEKCKQLLSSTDNSFRSVTTIAYLAGFNDASHFSKRFKREYGITPREYRENIKPLSIS